MWQRQKDCVGKWKNRADKPFNIDWQNEKIEGLRIWLGNKGVEDLTLSHNY